MMSLRWRLFLILLLATGAVWLSAAAWIHQRTNREVERVLDSRLQEAARMVHSLVSDDGLAGSRSDGKGPSPVLPLPSTGYERQLSCQIWSIAGRLVGRSSGAPEAALTEQSNGFSERVVAGEKWRVYAIEDPVKGVRILVGDRLDLRDRLIADLIAGLLAPALLIVPLLGGLTWLSVGRGLQPLSALAGRLRSRGAADMSAISLENAPPEVAPLIDALNDLLVRLEQARNHERDVTAFAAHELRTPLAGLKAQAQIAMMAADAETKDKALRQIVHSVDRASRLVRQLLALARIEAGYQAAEPETIDLEALIADIAAACSQPNAPATRLHPSLRGRSVRCDRELLTAALRNLQENAVCYSPPDGTITWRATDDAVGVIVEDEGPGIPPEELADMPKRFFRGRRQTGMGTGLGLSIVDLALRRLGGTVSLQNRADGTGLAVTICLAQVAKQDPCGCRWPPR